MKLLKISMKKEKLEPFNLEKAKQGAKLVTDNGNPARIICWDCKYEDYALVALVLINGKEVPKMFMENGISYMSDSFQDKLQIVEEVEVPDRWRDNGNATIYGHYVDEDSTIRTVNNIGGASNSPDNRNIFATEKQAQSALAMAQISQIIANDKRFGGAITAKEWNNGELPKYVIRRSSGDIITTVYHTIWHFLAFHTEEQRDLFLEENRDLIKQYYML